MKKILVTGANGQLGQEIQYLSAFFPDFTFLFTSRQTLDIAEAKSIQSFFQEQQPDYCINCAAYTAVDKAESEPNQAARINTDGVFYLASQCHAGVSFQQTIEG